jgi:hypothetical protein
VEYTFKPKQIDVFEMVWEYSFRSMRYYIKCKLNAKEKQRLTEAMKSGSLARGKIFYEGMQTALRKGTRDENNIVHFVEICYCLEGGLYPWQWKFQP